MTRLLITFLTVCCLLISCGSTDPGITGDSCEIDKDCENLCVTYLSGANPEGKPVSLIFPGGMCTKRCETPGEWDKFDLCLTYRPSGEKFLFPSCRNSEDCRKDEGYTCVVVGYDGIFQPMKTCLPPGI